MNKLFEIKYRVGGETKTETPEQQLAKAMGGHAPGCECGDMKRVIVVAPTVAEAVRVFGVVKNDPGVSITSVIAIDVDIIESTAVPFEI